MTLLPFAVATWLFLMGLYGMVTSRNLIHLVVCLTVVQSSTYVLLLAIGFRTDAAPPPYSPRYPSARLPSIRSFKPWC